MNLILYLTQIWKAVSWFYFLLLRRSSICPYPLVLCPMLWRSLYYPHPEEIWRWLWRVSKFLSYFELKSSIKACWKGSCHTTHRSRHVAPRGRGVPVGIQKLPLHWNSLSEGPEWHLVCNGQQRVCHTSFIGFVCSLRHSRSLDIAVKTTRSFWSQGYCACMV